MKKVIYISAATLLVLVILGGLGVAYKFRSQDRGGAPPASVRNAPEAPKFDASKNKPTTTAEKPPEYQLPTDFKLPTELDIGTPQVPEGLSTPASGPKG